MIGSLVGNVAEFLSSPNAQDLIRLLGGPQALNDAFLAAEISIMGLLAAAYGVSAAEPSAQRGGRGPHRGAAGHGHHPQPLGEQPLRGCPGRGHCVDAAGRGVDRRRRRVAVDDTALVGRSTVAALAQIPAAWVVTSVVLAVFGWAPRLAGAVWGVLLGFVALGEFGVLWNAPEWLMDLSPFRHSPLLPVDSGGVPALVALVLAAAALAALGYAGWRRRDLAA